MASKIREFPKSWARDRITKYIDAAIHNIVATYQAKGPAYPTLSEVDDIFTGMVVGLVNTEFIFEAELLMRAHSAFRAGCMLAMGGQVTESFMVNRVVLENGLYALHIYKNKTAGDIWLNRHRDNQSLRRSKQEFTYQHVIETFKAVNNDITTVADNLYQRTIDFGAHPNERAVTSEIQIVDEAGNRR